MKALLRKTSLQGRFILLLATLFVACLAASVALTLYAPSWQLLVPAVSLLGLLAVIAAVKAFFAPMDRILQALRSGVTSFRDHDYSVTIVSSRDDELGQLVQAYNGLAKTLRAERFGIFQRELLLDTVIQSSAVAVVIVNQGGSIVYSNREALELFSDPARGKAALEGADLAQISQRRSAALSEALLKGEDGLISLQEQEEAEVFHLTCRQFVLNSSTHRLYLLKKLTREIARKEVETWKKVIRVITHEMNNSLAPISSLIGSAQKIAATGAGTEKLPEIYTSIGNRASHLQTFIEEYARFARLPKPRPQRVAWQAFVDQMHRLVDFEMADDLPVAEAEFDPVQMEQVLINLFKNAAESGSPPAEVRLRVLQNSREVLIAVEDRGSGMAQEQMKLALLPFYSTKRGGTGLGLPLCREIIEAHGGTFNLFNREGGGTVATCKLPQLP
jgi:nitrogen fixation/metabolism regulation signal transduction histidine kinase